MSAPSNSKNGNGMPPRPASGAPAATGAPSPGRGEDDAITLAIRLEPTGPTTAIRVSRGARIEEVKDQALRRFNVPEAEAQKCIVTIEGKILDEARTVRDLGLSELAFLSVGLLDDVYIDDRDQMTKSSMRSKLL